MLDESAVKLAKRGPLTLKEARAHCARDPRWQAAEEDARELFSEWVEERERQQHDNEKLLLRRRREAFLEFLRTSCPWVTAETTWRKAQERLGGHDVYDSLGKLDRLEVWEVFMAEVAAKDAEVREKELEKRRRRERENREAFRQVLARHRQEGIITAGTRWKVSSCLIYSA